MYLRSISLSLPYFFAMVIRAFHKKERVGSANTIDNSVSLGSESLTWKCLKKCLSAVLRKKLSCLLFAPLFIFEKGVE